MVNFSCVKGASGALLDRFNFCPWLFKLPLPLLMKIESIHQVKALFHWYKIGLADQNLHCRMSSPSPANCFLPKVLKRVWPREATFTSGHVSPGFQPTFPCRQQALEKLALSFVAWLKNAWKAWNAAKSPWAIIDRFGIHNEPGAERCFNSLHKHSAG